MPAFCLANLARVLKDSTWTKTNGENNTKHTAINLPLPPSLAAAGAGAAFAAGAAFSLPAPGDGNDGKENDGKENPPPLSFGAAASFFAFLPPLAKLFVFGACWTIALFLVYSANNASAAALESPAANWAISDAANAGCASMDTDNAVATAACCKEDEDLFSSVSSFWAEHRRMDLEEDFTFLAL